MDTTVELDLGDKRVEITIEEKSLFSDEPDVLIKILKPGFPTLEGEFKPDETEYFEVPLSKLLNYIRDMEAEYGDICTDETPVPQ